MKIKWKRKDEKKMEKKRAREQFTFMSLVALNIKRLEFLELL